MVDIKILEDWYHKFPGSHIGMLLVGNVNNSKRTTPLDDRKKEIESCLRDKYAGFSRADILSIDTLNAYKNMKWIRQSVAVFVSDVASLEYFYCTQFRINIK